MKEWQGVRRGPLLEYSLAVSAGGHRPWQQSGIHRPEALAGVCDQIRSTQCAAQQLGNGSGGRGSESEEGVGSIRSGEAILCKADKRGDEKTGCTDKTAHRQFARRADKTPGAPSSKRSGARLDRNMQVTLQTDRERSLYVIK